VAKNYTFAVENLATDNCTQNRTRRTILSESGVVCAGLPAIYLVGLWQTRSLGFCSSLGPRTRDGREIILSLCSLKGWAERGWKRGSAGRVRRRAIRCLFFRCSNF